MSDLISRSALIGVISKMSFDFGNDTDDTETIIEMVNESINNQPTAYDVDKVVEELEKYATSTICNNHKSGCPYRDNGNILCENCGALGAIDIVKRGGVE